MSTTLRFLFPSLPPEIRYQIYSHLSTISAANSHTLPLKLRTYTCKHTVIELLPVHYGSWSFLALSRYRIHEVLEYRSWLLHHALELCIGVVFKGRVTTFCARDWATKVDAHLRKLTKRHVWLARVTRYQVRMLWDPTDTVLRSRKTGRTAGDLIKDMLGALTGLLSREVKRRKGYLSLGLCLAHEVAVQSVVSGARFGFEEVFSGLCGEDGRWERCAVEVWKGARRERQELNGHRRLVSIEPVKQEDKVLLAMERDSAKRTFGAKDQSIIKKDFANGRAIGVTTCTEKLDAAVDYIALSLLGECLGQV